MNTSSRTRKTKNLGFFLRIFSLIIIVSGIIISVVFSAKYVENNSKLSIEFAGGYQTQVQYEGKGKQKDVINLLKDRVDPLGTSNVYIESITSNNNKYNLALSKDAGVDISTFVHSVSRRGYSYIVDKDGNDLLATEKKDDKATTWTKRDKRLLTSDVFSAIKAVNNSVTHRPELLFDVKNDSVLKELTSAKENTFYIYSDIGQLLDYIRSSMEGIRSLAFIIDNLKNDPDGKIKASLTSLLDNNTPGLGKGTDILARAKAQDPTLAWLLNPNQNGQFGINWIYSDNLGSVHSLSVDTNDEKNTYDPANRFDPFASPIVGSPMNAWLPYIKDLLRLPDVSDILHEDVIDYRYIPYWVGEVKVTNNSISINSDTFNLETVKQMKSVLTSGLSKNNFTMLSYANVSPTLGVTSLKIAVVIIILVTFVLMTIVLFYYRMLGVIVLIIISLFLLFTIVSFVFINGIIAPESVIALIIGFALSLDTIINLLERFKNEYMQGKTLISAFKSANKKTLSSSLDCSAIILIVNLTIFWFGTRAIKGFIIMTSIATFGVIIFGIILLRLMLWTLLRNNWLENKPQLLGTNNINRKSTIVLNNSIDTNNIKSSDKKIKDQLISEKCQLKISYKNKVKELIKKFKVDKQQLKKEHSKSRSVYKSKVKDLKLNLSQEINKLKQELINALKPLKIQIVKAKDKKILVNFKNVFSKLKISNWNYFHKLTKWILSGSAVIVLASGITYGVIGSNFGSGFDQRTDFVGMGTITQDPSDPSYNIIKEAELAKDFISKEIQNNSQFSKYFKNINFSLIAGGEGKPYQFKIIVQTTVNSQSMQQRFKNFLGEITRNWKQESILQWGEIDLVVAKSGVDLLVNMIISIALSFIVILIYIIIRFQLTYVIPLILAIIFSLLMTLAIISIFQIVISTSIVGILLGVMILTIISIMSIFDNIREIKINNNQTQVISTEEIIEISNKSVQKALPRTLVINGVVLITSVIVMFIIPSFWIVSLSLLIGCIVSLVSSYFIAPFIWIYFEKWRVYRYKKRINKIKKHFIGADEYVIKGINE
ncbi:protein translocase subunit SecDF [Spiroplasma endosymbiont of Danaus chrysippus]|uniref:protein translocase subunit SecDF n=1 Tax=Spiroplasma endosymbiont of Danaus chrysippus TaxID=2691041 RepID=UPI00157B591A|nr:protein translocase [Spiroplasma endosymbiont of Danaus chrysippus]